MNPTFICWGSEVRPFGVDYLISSVLQRIVQGVSKGIVAERLLLTMQQMGVIPDFVLCIGDDRSDEDMFEVIMSARASLSPVADVFPCTVGQKPSKAKYYLEDTSEILRMLQGLVNASEQSVTSPPQPSHLAFWYL